MLEVYACRRPVILAASRQAGGIPEGSAILLDCGRREDRHAALAPGLQRRAQIIIGIGADQRLGKRCKLDQEEPVIIGCSEGSISRGDRKSVRWGQSVYQR